jgi:hypothetical protein
MADDEPPRDSPEVQAAFEEMARRAVEFQEKLPPILSYLDLSPPRPMPIELPPLAPMRVVLENPPPQVPPSDPIPKSFTGDGVKAIWNGLVLIVSATNRPAVPLIALEAVGVACGLSWGLGYVFWLARADKLKSRTRGRIRAFTLWALMPLTIATGAQITRTNHEMQSQLGAREHRSAIGGFVTRARAIQSDVWKLEANSAHLAALDTIETIKARDWGAGVEAYFSSRGDTSNADEFANATGSEGGPSQLIEDDASLGTADGFLAVRIAWLTRLQRELGAGREF